MSKKRFLNITPDDIYNFDESGFAMGVSATTKVITQPFRTGRRGVLQAGNREWVTVIESICASGRALPPYIIFKGKNFMVRWFDSLPKHWALEGLSGNAKQGNGQSIMQGAHYQSAKPPIFPSRFPLQGLMLFFFFEAVQSIHN